MVPVGTTVVWTNRDDIPHTVAAADGGPLRSAPLDTGDQFAFTFTQAGTFSYFCSIHPKMRGTIVVRRFTGIAFLSLRPADFQKGPVMFRVIARIRTAHSSNSFEGIRRSGSQ